MGGVIDEAKPLREGDDGVDVGRLEAWLVGVLGESARPVGVERFTRGYSNLTYRVTAGARDLVLRRPPVGVKIASAHDMAREYRLLAGVGKVWDRVPKTVALCEDEAVLGAPFYVMERVRGVVLRNKAPEGLELTPATMAALSRETVDTLAAIHRVDTAAAGLDLGHPEGYVERQVAGWTKRYQAAKTDDLPDVDALAKWLAENRPAESGSALVHNDFKYDNVVLDPGDPTRILAVLDWELATRGDPLLDLGTSLAYWMQADDPPELIAMSFGVTWLPGNLDREGVVARYVEATGRGAFDPLWYFAFGLFKLIVIAQQLYARFKAGKTTEPRYALMLPAEKALAAFALRGIGRRRISDLGG